MPRLTTICRITATTVPLRASIALVMLTLLGACGSSNDPARMPALPAENVLEAAEIKAFRSIDARSFQQAVVLYPADSGAHYVPVGDYLATRLARAFPAGADVNALRLDRWDAVCEPGGAFSDNVECGLVAAATFQLQGRVREIRFGVAPTDLGDQASISRQSAYQVSFERQDDSFGGQMRRLIDLAARNFREQLSPMLLEDQERRLF